METAIITANNIPISYTKKPATEPALSVVFIHGFPFNKSIWDAQLKSLPENVEGIAYDIRGHGATESGHSFFSVDLFARDLISLIAALNLQKVVLCGVSMGGYIALRALERTVENVAGLVLVDTHSFADTNDTKLARFEGIETIISKGKAKYADGFIKKLFAAETWNSRPEVVSLIRKSIVENDADCICSTLLALASRTDTTISLANITIPTLIIRGEEDQIVTHDLASSLQQHVKGSKLHTIPNAGHLPNLEAEDKFNLLLNNFITAL